MYKVVLSNEFKEWLESLDDYEQESVIASIKVLRQYGYQLGRPHADTLKGSDLTNLKELRIQHAGKPYRAFFIFDPLRQAIMLCGGDKTGDKRFYDRMIPLAEQVYTRYLATLDNKDKKS